MSQFWDAHWAEDPFKPARLGNWQVPNWHPKFPCARHCATTTFLADRSGRLLPDLPRSKRSPWGDFKGTWELPLKIDRKLAQKLSAPPMYKRAAWKAHKIRYQGSCGTTVRSKNETSPRKMGRKPPAKELNVQIDKTVTESSKIVEKNLTTLPRKPEKNATQKEAIESVDREEHKEDEKNASSGATN